MNKLKSSVAVASGSADIVVKKRVMDIANAFSMIVRVLSLPFILLSKLWLIVGLLSGVVFYAAFYYDAYKIGYGVKAVTEAVNGGKNSIENILFCIISFIVICNIVVKRFIPFIFSSVVLFFFEISFNAEDSIRKCEESVARNDKIRRYGSLENYVTASMEEFRQGSNYVSRGADANDCNL